MKRHGTNGPAAEETVNVPCMSQKELIDRLNKSNKKLLALNKELSAIEAKRNKEPEKVELIIDALIVKKKVIDEVCDSLVAATSCKEKRICQDLKKNLLLEIAYYNKLVAVYRDLTGGVLTAASTSIPDDIMAGEDYQVLPLLSYTTEDIYEEEKVTTEAAVMSQKELAKYIRTVDHSIENTKADYAKAVRKVESTEGQEKVVAILEAMKLKKIIFDSDIELLKATKQASDKRAMAMAKSRLTFTARDYNSLVDEYEKLAGGELTRASKTIADDIINGRPYTVLPDITYTVKDPEDGEEKDYESAKRDTNRRAKQKAERELSALQVKVNEQGEKDVGVFAKAAAFRIALLESERDSLRIGFGKTTGDIKRRTKEINREIDNVKKSAKAAAEYEKMDNARYYFTVVNEPELTEYPKRKVDVEKVKSIRKKIIELLNERDEVNNKLISLYTGSEVNADGTNVNQVYRRVKTQAAERLTKKGEKSAKKVHKLVATPEEKQNLYDLLNKKLDAESSLAVISYRLRNEKLTRKEKKLIKEDAENCAKIVNQCECDIDWHLRKIQKRQKAKHGGWGIALVLALIVIVGGAIAAISLL
ncbi:MAG: hypothetical protein IJW66_00525 [Clostridia bacterium]|nr:hypothetical protein [Clostridia bacterium]